MDNRIFALTISPRVKWGNVIFQPEFRMDQAQKPIFSLPDETLSNRESHILLALIYKFGTYPK